jgi:hypothetical protein
MPDYNADQRADLDMCGYSVGSMSGTFSMVLELNASGAAFVPKWRTSDRQFVRLDTIGSEITDTGDPRKVDFDLSLRPTGDPDRSNDQASRLITLNYDLVDDDTWGKAFLATVVNALTAVA